MKKNVLFGLLSIFIGFTLMAQEVTNWNLEKWEIPQNYAFEDPVDWQTPNKYTTALSIYTTTKSTDAASGLYSARLESISVSGYITPGVITRGNFEVDFQNFTAYLTGGIPFTHKPIALTGMWKNYPVEGDFTMIIVYFTKYFPSKGQSDTIGMGTLLGTETIDEWTKFSVPIEYIGEDDPDTMNLHVISSNMADLKEGSYMFVDDLDFEYPAGINEINIIETNVFPNPVSEQLNLSYDKEINGELRIFNTEGQLVYSAAVKGLEHKADVSTLAPGNYYYGLFENEKKLSSGQFVISR
jgi:hypothetical protein